MSIRRQMSESTWAPLTPTEDSTSESRIRKSDEIGSIPCGDGNIVWRETDESSFSKSPIHHGQASNWQKTMSRASGPADLTDKVVTSAPWTKEEDDKLITLVHQGASWDDCANQLPGRSSVSCQNHFDEMSRRGSHSMLGRDHFETHGRVQKVDESARSPTLPSASTRRPPFQPGPLEGSLLNSHVQIGPQVHPQPDQASGAIRQPGPLEGSLLNSPVQIGPQIHPQPGPLEGSLLNSHVQIGPQIHPQPGPLEGSLLHSPVQIGPQVHPQPPPHSLQKPRDLMVGIRDEKAEFRD